MKLQVKITATSLRIRKQANTTSATAGYLSKGQIVTVTKESGGFYYLSDGKGWIGKKYTSVVKNLESSQTSNKTDTKAPTTKAADTGVKSTGIDTKLISMLYNASRDMPNNISASTRLFGSPHQFSPLTDFRIGTEEYGLGRKFLEANIAEAPIVYFLPGRPNYLPDSSSTERDAINTFLLDNKNTENKTFIDKIVNNKDFRYFSFLTDYAKYMRYVNLLCRTCAIYMGLGDKTAPKSTAKYKYYNWQNYRFETTYKQAAATEKTVFNLQQIKESAYEALFGEYQYVQFYVDPSTSFSESSSNSTAQSKMADVFDSAQGIVKELSFLMSASAISKNGEAMQNFATGIDEINDKLKGTNENFFKRLLGASSNILSGSNLIFPEIWGDAAYNKSYNCTINLVSPYGDKESIYLNIMVPLMHILALSMPRQTSANSYASPFLIKAFAKGWFSCQMGIIDSISIDKGGQGSWSVDQLPTEVRVQIGIKDLYGSLTLPSSAQPQLFFQNPGLIEFLAVSCGIDVTKPEFATKLDALFSTLVNTATDIPTNLYDSLIQKLRNSIEGLYKIR